MDDLVFQKFFTPTTPLHRGLGIDRLTMMLTSQMNIKEVLLFPAMKPQGMCFFVPH